MDSEILLVLVILFCFLVLAVVIMVVISGRSKESTDYVTPQMPGPGMGNTGMGNTRMGNTRMGETGMGNTRMGETVSGGTVSGSFDERLQKLIDQWKIIEAVKLVRETKNIGLKEAKDYINKFMRGEDPDANTSSEGIMFESSENDEPAREDLEGKVNELLMKKQKIRAIKLVKENLNIGLKEAKDYVEEIEKKLNI
jgi:ribosomal protein L7/L12